MDWKDQVIRCFGLCKESEWNVNGLFTARYHPAIQRRFTALLTLLSLFDGVVLSNRLRYCSPIETEEQQV